MTGMHTTNPRGPVCCHTHTHTLALQTPHPNVKACGYGEHRDPQCNMTHLSSSFGKTGYLLEVSSRLTVLGPWDGICRWNAALHRAGVKDVSYCCRSYPLDGCLQGVRQCIVSPQGTCYFHEGFFFSFLLN